MISLADGLTHHRYLKIGWAIIIPMGIFIVLILTILNVDFLYLYPIFFYLNYLACNIVDPDADQIGVTSSEGIVLRTSKHLKIGFIGALFVSYSFLYAYLIGLVGGHRSPISHGWIIGTIGRMIFYNIPLFIGCWEFYNYGIQNWGWTLNIGLYESTRMQIWLIPYLSMQFVAWFIGDGIHLILDTEWAKGKLYTPIKQKRQG